MATIVYRRASEQAQLLGDTRYTTPRLRFELLFYEPLDRPSPANPRYDPARPTTWHSAKTLLYQHPDDPKPLVCEAITGIPGQLKGVDSRTRDNYYAILEAFRPALQTFPSDERAGRKLYDDKFACGTLLNVFSQGEEPETLIPELAPWLEACRPHLKKNKPTPALYDAIQEALRVFSESRGIDPLVFQAFDIAKQVPAANDRPAFSLNVGYRDKKGQLKNILD